MRCPVRTAGNEDRALPIHGVQAPSPGRRKRRLDRRRGNGIEGETGVPAIEATAPFASRQPFRRGAAGLAGTGGAAAPAVECSRGMDSPASGIFPGRSTLLVAGRERWKTRRRRARARPPPALPIGGARRGEPDVEERFTRSRGRMRRVRSKRAGGCREGAPWRGSGSISSAVWRSPGREGPAGPRGVRKDMGKQGLAP